MPDMTPGVPSALSPLVRRIVGPNPGPMTGSGTNTYLVGIDEVAVIDPGPDEKSHVDAIVGASMRERVRWVVLTHSHPDHVPATTRLVEATGAEVLAFSNKPQPGAKDDEPTVHVDRTIGEGDVIEGTEWGLEVLHTPGHSPDHICLLLEEERVLFTGDTVLDGTTSVVNPARGGDMKQYLATLDRLRKMRLTRLCPGHGEVIDEPRAYLDEYIKHRRARERQVLDVLGDGPSRIRDIVERLYPDVVPELHDMAGNQVYAHLLKLRAEGKVSGRDTRSIWKLA
jgi:glyoxylase-like metal-dependent hydrolase (beta-lactamase superfamily II)